MKTKTPSVPAATVLALAACGGASEAAVEPAGPPLVVCTFAPTEYLARRLVQGDARVVCDLPEDVDALFWEPPDEALLRMQEADLIVLHGAGMDTWRDRVSLPASRVVVLAERFRDRWIDRGDAAVHTHVGVDGGTEEHSHAGLDPHAWVDPLLWLEEARALGEALHSVLGAERATELDRRLDALAEDLRGLHDALAALELPDGESLYASHPAYDYLAARHGWSVVSFDLDPGRAPTAGELADVRAALGDRPGRICLWESEPVPAASAALADLGLESVVYAPAEIVTEAERAAGTDVLSIQRANVERLRAALEGGR